MFLNVPLANINRNQNMLRVRLKIGDGAIKDTTDYGLVYLSADHRFAPETKGFEATSYPEEEGEHILTKTVDAPFDYKVRFFIDAGGSLGNANDIIADFNSRLYHQDNGSDLKEFYQVEFYNDYKKVKIVGYPHPISEATDFWRDQAGHTSDVVVVEWTIRVIKPSLCDFNLE